MSRRRVLVGLAVVVGLLLVAGGWLGFRVWQAGTALRELEAGTDGLRGELESGDIDGLTARLPQLQDDAARADAAADDPLWRLAAHVPFVGENLRAVGVVARTADVLLADSVPDLIDALEQVQDPARALPEGQVDLAPLADAAPAVATAASALDDARVELADIDQSRLVGPVAGAVENVDDALAGAGELLASVRDVAEVLPVMLGADGPRTYLLLSLNSAELRSAGGIVGSVAVLQADDGAVSLVGLSSTADLPELDASALPLTDEELALHGDRLGRWIQDSVLTPDYPRAAELAAAFWAARTGQQVDGVIATDLVAVTGLLGASGQGIEADGATLTADDLIPALLSDAYLAYGDPKDGDRLYAAVAAQLFTALAQVRDDTGAVTRVVQALGDAVGERRVRVWSADADEEGRLAATGVGGAFLSSPDAGDAVGVFLDDGTAGKLDYYLDTSVSVRMTGCETTSPVGEVEVSLSYAPPDDIADYPAQVTGDGGSGLPAGSLATNLSLYGRTGDEAIEIRRDGSVIGGRQATADGRPVMVLTSRLAPGESQTYTFEVPATSGRVEVWATPTLTSPGLVTGVCTAP